MQAVVNQTISGLACGKPIKGNVIFLGGPLNYLSMLKARFIDTLGLKENEIITPEDARLFVCIGAVLDKEKRRVYSKDEIAYLLEDLKTFTENESTDLPA